MCRKFELLKIQALWDFRHCLIISEKDILLSVSGFGSNTNFNLLGMLTLVAENVGYICLLGSPSSVTGGLWP